MTARSGEDGQGIGRQQLSAWKNATVAYFLGAGLFQSTWYAEIPSLTSRLGLNVDQASILVASFALGAVLGLSCAPTLYRKLGPRAAQALAASIMAPAFVLAGLAGQDSSSLSITSLLIVLAAAGFGLFDVSMNVGGAAVERLAGRSLMPRFHAMYSAGALAGSGLAVVFALGDVPTTTHFAAVTFTVLAIVGPFLRATPRTALHQPHRGGRRIWERARSLLGELGSLQVLLLGVTLLGFTAAENSAVNWIALATERDHRFENVVATLSLVVFLLATTVSRFLGGLIVDRLGRALTLRLAALTAASGILAYVFLGDSLPILLAAAILWGTGVAVGFPVLVSAAADTPHRGHAAVRVSAMSTFGYAASFLAPVAVGMAGHAIGLLPTLSLLSALLALSLATAKAAGEGRDAAPARSAGDGH